MIIGSVRMGQKLRGAERSGGPALSATRPWALPWDRAMVAPFWLRPRAEWGKGAELRGAKRARRARHSAAAGKPPKLPKRRLRRGAEAVVLGSVAPSKAGRARSSAAARKPPKMPKR